MDRVQPQVSASGLRLDPLLPASLPAACGDAALVEGALVLAPLVVADHEDAQGQLALGLGLVIAVDEVDAVAGGGALLRHGLSPPVLSAVGRDAVDEAGAALPRALDGLALVGREQASAAGADLLVVGDQSPDLLVEGPRRAEHAEQVESYTIELNRITDERNTTRKAHSGTVASRTELETALADHRQAGERPLTERDGAHTVEPA